MKGPIHLRLHVLLLGGVIAFTAGAHVAFRGRYAQERNKLAHQAAGVRAREIQAAWKALPYIAASDPVTVQALVSKIDWTSLNLSDPQKAKLQGRVERVLAYLFAPTLDEYCQLKTCGLRYRFSPSRSAQMILADSERGSAKPLRIAAAGAESIDGALDAGGECSVTRAVWERTAALQGPPWFSKLTGVSLHGVSAALSPTNTPTALLKGSVAKGWTSATEALNPGFQYPALSDRPTTNNTSLFFHLSFFAQTDGGNRAGPVYLCLGWLPGDEEWALCRMISDSMLGIRILF